MRYGSYFIGLPEGFGEKSVSEFLLEKRGTEWVAFLPLVLRNEPSSFRTTCPGSGKGRWRL
jgi:hypothetical protein